MPPEHRFLVRVRHDPKRLGGKPVSPEWDGSEAGTDSPEATLSSEIRTVLESRKKGNRSQRYKEPSLNVCYVPVLDNQLRTLKTTTQKESERAALTSLQPFLTGKQVAELLGCVRAEK